MAADSGMDTCPSPEIADSRKRPLDGDTENGEIKRSHFSSGNIGLNDIPPISHMLPNGEILGEQGFGFVAGGDVSYNFKILVPSVAAGAIMGKKGEAIGQLQKTTGTKIKMSKSHDFYPGTSERICIITGTVDAILAAMDFITEKIREKPDLTKSYTDLDPKIPQERDKQIKILVPNSTAGMIIGKGGNYIKQIKETTGSYVQISQKAKDLSLQERCITVIGDKESNRRACMMILAKVVDDPQSGTCSNVSYAEVTGPVANYNPTGSPYAHNQQMATLAGGPPADSRESAAQVWNNYWAHAFSSSTASLNSSGLGGVGGAAGVFLNGGALGSLNLTLNLAAPQPANATLTAQMFDHIKVTLRSAGYNETSIGEICAALGLLAKHGVLGLGLAALPPAASLPSALPYYPMASDQAASASVFGPIGPVSLGNTSPTTRSSLERFNTDIAFEQFRQPAVAPISLNNNSFGLGGGQGLMTLSKSPTPGDLVAKDTKNVEIAEVIVGAILGPGGRNLMEIQHRSGAVVQISKKGSFAPGTRNRIVTISGSPSAINDAHYYIQVRVSEEEAKRSRHNTLSGIMQ